MNQPYKIELYCNDTNKTVNEYVSYIMPSAGDIIAGQTFEDGKMRVVVNKLCYAHSLYSVCIYVKLY